MKIIFIMITLMLIFSYCSEGLPPTPDFSINPFLEEESKTIPWELITGQIIYCNQLRDVLVLIDGETKKLSIITEERLSNLVWHPIYENFSGIYSDNLNIIIGIGKGGIIPHLYTYNLDGQHIPTNYSYITAPISWSVDLRIAHTRFELYTNLKAYIDGDLLYSEINCVYTRPAWSHDNQQIVFSIFQNETSASYAALLQINVEDTTTTILIQTEEDSITYRDPIYSPDGNKLLYVKRDWRFFNRKLSPSEIWVINSDGSGNQRLTSNYCDFYPAWSPGGDKIIFCRQSPEKDEFTLLTIGMFMLNNDGSELIQILSAGSVYPSWKP
jgi:hypothetical protein